MFTRTRNSLFAFLVCVSCASTAAEPPAGVDIKQSFTGDEPLLINAMNKVNQQKLDSAISDIEGLVERNPKFKLAQLVYGDLLMAKAGLPGGLGRSPFAEPSDGQNRMLDLQKEARVRWMRYSKPDNPARLPANMLRLSETQRTSIVVDLSRSRLYVYENEGGKPRLLADFYVTAGKNGFGKRVEGDKKTPLGVYFVTSELDTKKLPDLYGSGAFPIDYPNAWDRRQGYTGHGIWLHGVPSNTYSRAPNASDGCLAMSNKELDLIKPFLQPGVTPVIIAENIERLDVQQLEQRRAELSRAMTQWERDWESLDADAYLAHYSKDFRSDDRDLAGWRAHKRRVNGNKRYIRVQRNDLSMFAYPGEQDMVVVSYEQDYQSSNLNGKIRKRQYWKKEVDGQWRIVYEGKG